MNSDIKVSEFGNEFGREIYFTIEAPNDQPFQDSLMCIKDCYRQSMKDMGVMNDSEIFLKFHTSDVTNQAPQIFDSFINAGVSFLSVIGQPPASGSKIAIEAYHIDAVSPIRKKKIHQGITVSHGGYTSIWQACRPIRKSASFEQTHQVFGQMSTALNALGTDLENGLIRTWLYMRDVDNNYQGMVDARRELFRFIGLNESTHYVASTGIEGAGPNVSDLVVMDALGLSGHQRKQIRYMDATDYLSPTHAYGVTFERGTRVVFQDRSHYYISGTASIDKDGNILHNGDVARQCERTLTNIEALLVGQDGHLSDLRLLIVYIRDMADKNTVRSFCDQNLPKALPRIIVLGPVCRPGWLVEMEGVAVNDRGEQDLMPFC